MVSTLSAQNKESEQGVGNLHQLVVTNNWISPTGNSYPIFVKFKIGDYYTVTTSKILNGAAKYFDINDTKTVLSVSVGDDLNFVEFEVYNQGGRTYVNVVNLPTAGNNKSVPVFNFGKGCNLTYLPNNYTVTKDSTSLSGTTKTFGCR
jgi:hypothetical protein